MKKWLSYLLPIKLQAYTTAYNGILSVTLFNGRKMLDTAISNYSYGSLQKILYKALKKLPYDPATRSVLVLGMGAGSIIATLRNDFTCAAHITLVEIDPAVIAIAEKEFGLQAFPGITVIEADALQFMERNTQQFDLIIVDLFIIDTIPLACTQAPFLRQLSNSLPAGGRLIYNTMPDTLDNSVFTGMLQELQTSGMNTYGQKIDGDNELIFGFKN